MSYKVVISEAAKRDYRKLDNSQRLQVNKSFEKLQLKGGQVGEALRGKLAGYRKLKHRRLGLRIIFRETPKSIEIIEVIAIGKRSDNEIYSIAEKRIDNLSD
ncbi:type II toxin-antitoxin system RelE/ParE family toxin [Streptococcus sp. H49]|uniref:type II toxin-antitoxin system RelE family toxin n=1 Tax=Streptococcus huangxiaojuni TaxID=3237239 RepID=UPI0034A5C3A2